jgi:hypothetical protein
MVIIRQPLRLGRNCKCIFKGVSVFDAVIGFKRSLFTSIIKDLLAWINKLYNKRYINRSLPLWFTILTAATDNQIYNENAKLKLLEFVWRFLYLQ